MKPLLFRPQINIRAALQRSLAERGVFCRHPSRKQLLAQLQQRQEIETQIRYAHNQLEAQIQEQTRELLWANDVLLEEIAERKAAEMALQVVCNDLENRVEERTHQLSLVNAELRAQEEALKAANAQLEALATTDGLTGIKNHRAFQERLREEFERATRYNASLSLILLDVDKFKEYNDTFGHPAGDMALIEVAQVLQELVRSADTVARYGGEEFVILLPCTDRDGALACAERFRAAIETRLWDRAVTASFGVATYDHPTIQAETLLAQADEALYQSKKRGRNRVLHYEYLAGWKASAVVSSGQERGQAAVVNTMDLTLLSNDAQHITEKLTEAYDTTIEGWSRILDLRDKETEGHCERVTQMTIRLARALGYCEEDMVYVRWGALLHDIGKMGIPDSILLKPGPLNAEEWAIMQKHPGYAYEMLSPIAFLRPALDIPYCHHEKWDGSGYPNGLKGKEIPLAARLFAVVDVWDALRSDRPYRAGWPEEQVGEHLRAQKRVHFDPQIVDVFLRILAGKGVADKRVVADKNVGTEKSVVTDSEERTGIL